MFEWAWQRRLPLALAMAGGYGHDIGTTVRVQRNTFRVALAYGQRWRAVAESAANHPTRRPPP